MGPIDTRESEARQSQEDARTVSIAPGARSPFVINVHLWVNAKEANYEELAEELKKLLSRLSET